MTTKTATLTEFLLARISERESVARDMQHQASRGRPLLELHGGGTGIRDLVDPARVLTECEAKRRIVEVHHPHDHGGEHGDATFCTECQWDHGDDSPRIDNQPVENFGRNPCQTLATLAAVYADHPDYREEWKP